MTYESYILTEFVPRLGSSTNVPAQDMAQMVHKIPIEFTLDTGILSTFHRLWLISSSLSIHGKDCHYTPHLLRSMLPTNDLDLQC